MTIENPMFVAWIVAVVGLTWSLPKSTIPYFLPLTCAAFLGVYFPQALLTLSFVTIITAAATIYIKATATLLYSVVVCVILVIVYRITEVTQTISSTTLFIGVSFYSLRAIHLLIDVYLDRVKHVKLSELLVWLWFLPSLLIGPIHRFMPYKRELSRRRWDPQLFASGLKRVLFGYFKVIVIANYVVGEKLEAILNTVTPNSWWYHYLNAAHYGVDLYFRFSGYTDVAIGFSALLGLRIAENFNYPFLARSITDFWQRWHMSLSSWCRDYIYIPLLASSRSGAIAAIGSMLTLGIWHGVTWTYIAWGVWHGVGIAVCQRWQKTDFREKIANSYYNRLWAILAWVMTMNYVLLSFVLTGSKNIQDAIHSFKILLGLPL